MISTDTLATIEADQPPLGLGKLLAVLGDIEWVRPAGECLDVVGFVKPPVLPGVDEFVPDSLAELLPAEFLIGVPGEPDRDRLGIWVIFGDASLLLGPLGDLRVD